MREIKFRAWDKKSKKWICPPSYTHGEMKIAGEIYKHIDYLVMGIPNIENPNIEICQYTGLHDKNDKEIYEGDIVVGYTDFDSWSFEGKIIYSDYAQWLVERNDGAAEPIQAFDTYEIIGNIYENPELLSKNETLRSELGTFGIDTTPEELQRLREEG